MIRRTFRGDVHLCHWAMYKKYILVTTCCLNLKTHKYRRCKWALRTSWSCIEGGNTKCKCKFINILFVLIIHNLYKLIELKNKQTNYPNKCYKGRLGFFSNSVKRFQCVVRLFSVFYFELIRVTITSIFLLVVFLIEIMRHFLFAIFMVQIVVFTDQLLFSGKFNINRSVADLSKNDYSFFLFSFLFDKRLYLWILKKYRVFKVVMIMMYVENFTQHSCFSNAYM